MPRRSAPRPINRTNESNPVTMNQMNIFLKNKIKMSKDRLLQEQSTRMAEWRVSFTKLALFRTWRPEGKKERKLIVSLLSFPFLSSSSTDRHPPTSDALFRCLGYYYGAQLVIISAIRCARCDHVYLGIEFHNSSAGWLCMNFARKLKCRRTQGDGFGRGASDQ